jgi:cob(I)alamin adenosyltransferase
MKPVMILLNGPSSAGKSSIARSLQKLSGDPLMHIQLDVFAAMLPVELRGRCLYESDDRFSDCVVRAFHSAAVALAVSGSGVVVDHVVGEDSAWVSDFCARAAAGGVDVVCVGVSCDLGVLLERERCRSDRKGWPDIAERQHGCLHAGLEYDLEVDTTQKSSDECAQVILDFVGGRFGEECDAKRASGCLKEGYVQVYTGDGKGKTTAAAGLAVRAAGAGLRVFIGQFIKSKDSSEMAFLRERCSAVTVEQFGAGRFIKSTPSSEDLSGARSGIERLKSALCSGEYDVVIADEINGALCAGVVTIEDIHLLLDTRASGVEFVLTGRGAHPQLVERADLVTEMCCVKHFMDGGVFARKGIEF